MSAHPLTHHEIFTLVEPFAKQGRHVDLAASDRIARRLLFKPIEHEASGTDSSGLRELLELENPKADRYRLTRTLRHPCGLEAELRIEGTDPGALLDRIQSIAPQRQFRSKSGFRIARSYRLDGTRDPEAGESGTTRLIMTGGTARMQGLSLTIKTQTGRGMPADLILRSDTDEHLELPEDILAVLGWDWRRLGRVKDGWKSTLRLRGTEPNRSRDAEVKLTRAAEHLAETLGAPPSRYHERHAAARWTVAFRRALPLLIGLGLIFGAPAIQFLELSDGSLLRMLIFHSPPLLMVLFFTMKEMPRIEIPPFPRPLTARSWRTSPPEVAGETAGVRNRTTG